MQLVCQKVATVYFYCKQNSILERTSLKASSVYTLTGVVFFAMGALMKVLIVILVLVLAGGAVFLMNWEMPPPSEKIEKVIPNERILR